MPDIRHAITIDAPRDSVARLVSSAPGLAAWWAEDITPVPHSSALELGFFDRATVYRLVPKPAPDEVRWRCETGQEWAGTETIRNVGHAPGCAPRWLLKLAMRRSLAADLRRLKQAAEGRP